MWGLQSFGGAWTDEMSASVFYVGDVGAPTEVAAANDAANGRLRVTFKAPAVGVAGAGAAQRPACLRGLCCCGQAGPHCHGSCTERHSLAPLRAPRTTSPDRAVPGPLRCAADRYSWSLYKLAHLGLTDLTGITPTTGELDDLSTTFHISATPGL